LQNKKQSIFSKSFFSGAFALAMGGLSVGISNNYITVKEFLPSVSQNTGLFSVVYLGAISGCYSFYKLLQAATVNKTVSRLNKINQKLSEEKIKKYKKK